HEQLLQEVESVVRDLVCEDATEDYVLTWRVYGVNGVRMTPVTQNTPPGEAFILGECIAPTPERAAEVARTTKQYLLHHGYEGRLSTAGILPFRSRRRKSRLGPLTDSMSIISCGQTTLMRCFHLKSRLCSACLQMRHRARQFSVACVLMSKPRFIAANTRS